MFEAVYKSAWHQPYAFWLAHVLFAAVLIVRGQRSRWMMLALVGTAIAACDAWLTAESSPLAAALVDGIVGPAFAIIGDWRFYFVVFVGLRIVPSWPVAAGITLPLAATIPIIAYGAQLRGWVPAGRPMFLLYESLMTAFTLTLLLVVGRRSPTIKSVASFRRIAIFWLAMYALWAVADVLILRIGDVGYALRIVPNALYYVGFWPLVYVTFKDAQETS